MFKLLILDVDGVLTNGNKEYDKNHNIISKNFNDKDFTAIKRFLNNGIKVVILSGDNWNFGMAKSRNIPFYFAERESGKIKKLEKIKQICKEYNISLQETAVVVDDYYDLEIAEAVGYKYCPLDAIYEIKNICKVLKRNGGNGVLADLTEMYSELLTKYPLESDNMSYE